MASWPMIAHRLEQVRVGMPAAHDALTTGPSPGTHRRLIGRGESVLQWGQRYLPAHFRLPPSAMHRWLAEWLDRMRDERGVKLNVLGPRGGAKSTIATLAFALRAVVENREPYIWIVSDTRHQAHAHLENLKAELMDSGTLLGEEQASKRMSARVNCSGDKGLRCRCAKRDTHESVSRWEAKTRRGANACVRVRTLPSHACVARTLLRLRKGSPPHTIQLSQSPPALRPTPYALRSTLHPSPFTLLLPTQPVTHVAVLGSTGSIGRSTLEVIAASEGRLRAVALSANNSTKLLDEQARAVRPRWIIVTDDAAASRHDWSNLPKETELLVGREGVERVVGQADVDIVVSAIVGSAGLQGTWAALEAGKTVALANKESLVVGGPLVTRLAREKNARILPVDSEHCAVFQAMQAGRRDEVRRVILTASGGPFRNHTAERLAQVSVDEALDHPTWEMGQKITIDSATLMNKALEIIEARWLFDLEVGQISVVIHPQSIVHSMVEFKDGSIIAQLSPPDMKLPIQYALTFPERREGVAEKFDWGRAVALEFEPPDFERFGALKLGLEVAQAGGTAGAALNGANEAAVAAFLTGLLPFHKIVPVCRSVVNSHHFDPNPTLSDVLAMDRWARQEVERCICA